MGRRPEPAIRGALRERAIDYVTQHGFASVSLRPMAKKLRTSARMLVYHFGSREGLMREVLMGIREREDATIQNWFQKRQRPPTMPDFLRWYWRRMGVDLELWAIQREADYFREVFGRELSTATS